MQGSLPMLTVAANGTLLIIDAPGLPFVADYPLSFALVQEEARRKMCDRALLWYSRGATERFLTRRGWYHPEGHGVLAHVF